MIRQFRRLCLLFILFFPIVLSASDTCSVDVRDIKWLSAQDLAQSLKGRPRMTVGFDVDDTLLFSSPTFHHFAMERCPNDPKICMADKTFWDEINLADSYNLPKKVGMDLVKMHLARGDRVYFITARPPTDHETLSELLRAYLNTPGLPNVMFVGFAKDKNMKVQPMKQLKLAIYYGDADTDMSAAIEARVRPIRILRARNSTDIHPVCPGTFNEEVIVGSDI